MPAAGDSIHAVPTAARSHASACTSSRCNFYSSADVYQDTAAQASLHRNAAEQINDPSMPSRLSGGYCRSYSEEYLSVDATAAPSHGYGAPSTGLAASVRG